MNYIIIGGDNYNTLGMIRTLGEARIPVHAVIIRDEIKSASKSKYISKLIAVDSIEEAYKYLVNYANHNFAKEKTILLVEGDLNTTYLDQHYDVLSKKYIYSQAKGGIRKYMDKHEQINLARRCGLKVMPTYVVKKGHIPDGITYPIITKAKSSLINNWKEEVHICNTEQELKEAFKQIESNEVIIQQFVKKKNELCIDGYSINSGKDQIITIASTYNYIIPGKYSFSMTLSNYKDEKHIMPLITRMMTEVGYEGIYCIEFLIDENEDYWFLEINFRNSGWSYASTVVGMPLPLLWSDSMITGTINKNIIKPIKKNFIFIEDFNDFKARVMTLKMPLLKWIREYKSADCKLILGRNDPRPMAAYLFSRARKKFLKEIKHLKHL